MSNFLKLEGKKIVVTGVANRKSVAWFTAKTLEEAGAQVIYSVRSRARADSLAKLLEGKPVYICDVEREEEIPALAEAVIRDHGNVDGLVHSIAFANYAEGSAVSRNEACGFSSSNGDFGIFAR